MHSATGNGALPSKLNMHFSWGLVIELLPKTPQPHTMLLQSKIASEAWCLPV